MNKIRSFFRRRPTETIEEARRRVSVVIELIVIACISGALFVFGTPQAPMSIVMILGILTGVVVGAGSSLIAREYVQ